MGPPGEESLQLIVNSLQLIVYRLLFSDDFGLLADNLQIYSDFLGGFVEKAYFCGKVERFKGDNYEYSCFK